MSRLLSPCRVPAVDLASLVQTLLQQQLALPQVHGESMRLQRLLVERLLGLPSMADITHTAQQLEPPAATGSTVLTGRPLPKHVPLLGEVS
jgi:hypothetical protein